MEYTVTSNGVDSLSMSLPPNLQIYPVTRPRLLSTAVLQCVLTTRAFSQTSCRISRAESTRQHFSLVQRPNCKGRSCTLTNSRTASRKTSEKSWKTETLTQASLAFIKLQQFPNQREEASTTERSMEKPPFQMAFQTKRTLHKTTLPLAQIPKHFACLQLLISRKEQVLISLRLRRKKHETRAENWNHGAVAALRATALAQKRALQRLYQTRDLCTNSLEKRRLSIKRNSLKISPYTSTSAQRCQRAVSNSS